MIFIHFARSFVALKFFLRMSRKIRKHVVFGHFFAESGDEVTTPPA